MMVACVVSLEWLHRGPVKYHINNTYSICNTELRVTDPSGKWTPKLRHFTTQNLYLLRLEASKCIEGGGAGGSCPSQYCTGWYYAVVLDGKFSITRTNDAFFAKMVTTRQTKIFMAICSRRKAANFCRCRPVTHSFDQGQILLIESCSIKRCITAPLPLG